MLLILLCRHDAGTFDKETKTGGANASIRFDEMSHAANAGLKWAEEKLEPFKTKYEGISYADLYQVSPEVPLQGLSACMTSAPESRRRSALALAIPCLVVN